MAVRVETSKEHISAVDRQRLVQCLEEMRKQRSVVRAARQPSPDDEASEVAATAMLQDMETLYHYVKFLSEVLEHIPTKD